MMCVLQCKQQYAAFFYIVTTCGIFLFFFYCYKKNELLLCLGQKILFCTLQVYRSCFELINNAKIHAVQKYPRNRTQIILMEYKSCTESEVCWNALSRTKNSQQLWHLRGFIYTNRTQRNIYNHICQLIEDFFKSDVSNSILMLIHAVFILLLLFFQK